MPSWKESSYCEYNWKYHLSASYSDPSKCCGVNVIISVTLLSYLGRQYLLPDSSWRVE